MDNQVWKKVHESDLDSLCLELKDFVDIPAAIILNGEMGAGKTTLTRHLMEKIQPNQSSNMMSPTYSIINKTGQVVHADLYRIEDPEEILQLELELYLDHTNYFIVEWGRNYLQTLQNIIGEEFNYYEINISIRDEINRDIELKKLEY